LGVSGGGSAEEAGGAFTVATCNLNEKRKLQNNIAADIGNMGIWRTA